MVRLTLEVLWNVETFTELAHMSVGLNAITALAVSAGGEFIGIGDNEGYVSIFDGFDLAVRSPVRNILNSP